MRWSDFVDGVREAITVDGTRAGIQPALHRKIRDGARDLQSFIPELRKGHEAIYQANDVARIGEASEGELPAQAEVSEAYVITPGQPCRQTPLDDYPWQHRNDLICGASAGHFISIDPKARRFLVFPAIDTDSQIVLVWDGIKQSFSDADDVPFPEQAVEAVAAYTKSWVCKEVDKDRMLSREYWEDYAGGPGKMGLRTKLFLDMKQRARMKSKGTSPQPRMDHSVGVSPDATVEFCVISDTAQDGTTGTGQAAVAALVKSLRPDFVVHCGDALNGGDQSTIYEQLTRHYYGWIPSSFYLAFGDRDTETAALESLLYDQYALNTGKKYYDFVKGNAHIWVLNSNASEPDGVADDSTQAAWLQAGLAASGEAWNIVVLHHSPYDSDDDNDPGSTALRWPFADWGADLVISGHGRTYERLEVGGLPYIVCGFGGSDLGSFASTAVAGSQVRYNAKHGALRVAVTEDRLSVTAYNTDRTAVDRLALRKD